MSKKSKLAIYTSLLVNSLMFVIKAICYVLTRSVAIFAATLDSLMDLTSQAVNYFTRWNSESEKFPFGREKLSSVGTLICSILMVGMSTLKKI